MQINSKLCKAKRKTRQAVNLFNKYFGVFALHIQLWKAVSVKYFERMSLDIIIQNVERKQHILFSFMA